jgi:Flp pilus assembly protein TadG
MPCSGRNLLRNTDGAVAPTIALSLIALLACGGIAFDYSRMASMHTELQDAADQAALAAASQLDAQSGACARAAAAASNLLINKTYFASYGSGQNVTVPNQGVCGENSQIKFYQTYNQTTDTPGAAATDDSNAKFVIVTVDARQANYALTPIVGLFNSGSIAATAVATLGAGAICKVPPLMICNPAEGTPAGNLTFDADTYKGRGLKLEAGGGGAWAPGNYGYLDFGNGANTVEKAMGSNVDNDPCVSAASVATKPGNTASAPAGINTRFDMYENGLIAYCAASTGNCSPAVDVLKDVIHPQFNSGSPPNEVARTGQGNADNCAFANGQDPWALPSKQYLPDSVTRVQDATIGTPTSMGSPRDICHAISTGGDCAGGRFGNGSWDRDLYFQVNYGTSGTGWQSLSWLSSWATANGVTLSSISRYNVYRAEVAAIQAGTLQNASAVDAKRRLAETQTNGNGNGNGNSTNYYSYANARCAAAQGATATVKDRRVLTAAVVNCTAGNVHGAVTIAPIGWIDMFLVEPSINRSRTGQDQIYVEIIGGATRPDGGAPFQYYLKQRPRLIK